MMDLLAYLPLVVPLVAPLVAPVVDVPVPVLPLMPEVSVVPVGDMPELAPVEPVEPEPPLVAPPPVGELPWGDIGEVLSAALLVVPPSVELQAARLMAMRAPIITL
jgi:hypothetical protein